jgi:vancomycin permeability regulator SanA
MLGRRRRRSPGGQTLARARAAGASRLWPRDLARGVALFFGLFSWLNLVGELRAPGFDQNIWWLDLRPLPAAISAAALALAGLLFVWWGLRPVAGAGRRVATVAAALLLSLVAVRNGVGFYRAWQLGQIRPWMPLPLSFVLAGALLWIAWSVARHAPVSSSPAGHPVAAGHPAPSARRGWSALVVACALGACGLLFPLAQQVFFGKTDYVRAAQVAVVFGAEVHRDGHASVSLRDRVRTAAQLYKAGLAGRLLMSGAQGVGEPVNETAVMRSLAIGFGVPAAAIDVDPKGYNTAATVRDTVPVLRAAGDGRVAVVSDFFHLPRVKLAYERSGYDVITVPSRAHRIPQTTRLVVREIPAFWVYYLRAVLR